MTKNEFYLFVVSIVAGAGLATALYYGWAKMHAYWHETGLFLP